jgi:hypothetical protein
MPKSYSEAKNQIKTLTINTITLIKNNFANQQKKNQAAFLYFQLDIHTIKGNK